MTLISVPTKAAASPDNAEKTPRRSHAVRRAEGKAQIIEATVICLCRDGYGATTVDAILKESGVSRGKFLNLFPTKVDLMIEVSRHGWETSQKYTSDWLQKFDSLESRLKNFVDMAWSIMSQPEGVAVLEILVASRSDEALAMRFVPEHRRIQQGAIDQTRAFFVELGLGDTIDAEAHHRYVEACVRGLVVDRTFDLTSGETPKALEFAKEQIASLLPPAMRKAGDTSDA